MSRALPTWTDGLVPVDMDGAATLLGISRRFLVDVIRRHRHYEPRGNRKVFYPEHIERLRAVIHPANSKRDALVAFIRARVGTSRSEPLDAILTESETGSIYFIRCIDRIKIGFTEHWEGRYRILKTSCPYPVSLVALVSGNRTLELFLHRSLAEWRRHGEWFADQGDVAELIKMMEAANE